MSSDLQQDIDVMGSLVRQLNGWGLSSEESSAWQRLRARLEAVPDEDAVTEAVQKEAAGWATYLSDFEARQIAIAAIAAIKGDTK